MIDTARLFPPAASLKKEGRVLLGKVSLPHL